VSITTSSVAQRKFITYENVAVTVLTLTNTGSASTTRTVTASSPIATIPAELGTELTGSVTARYGLTTVTPRLSGDGMTVTGTSLTRTVTLEPGAAVTLKVQLGATTRELPRSTADYERFRGYDAETAFETQVEEYNRWWAGNVPYIDVPDENVKKMSYYRTFLNRYNHFDGNIPGNDYQFPVSIEGVLGYNNAIQLTQPMHMQDLKYFRDPRYAYGNWLSSGETSKCTAFTDNPGNTANWSSACRSTSSCRARCAPPCPTAAASRCGWRRTTRGPARWWCASRRRPTRRGDSRCGCRRGPAKACWWIEDGGGPRRPGTPRWTRCGRRATRSGSSFS
jgi:hypothetical protein